MVKAQSYKDTAYFYIKEQIDNNILMPNTHLKELDIAERLGMSRTPVRKAMAQLEEEGYVKIEPFKGAVVVKTSLTSTAIVEQLQFVELMAIQLFQHMQSKDIRINEKELQKIANQMMTALDRLDSNAYYQAEFEMFRFIVSYHTNTYFRQVALNTLATLHELYFKNANKETSAFAKEAKKIRGFYPQFFETIKAGDYPNARKQVRIWTNHLILDQINH